MRALTILCILLVALAPQLFTQDLSHPPEPNKDPFVGTWKANSDKSRPKLNKIEASYVCTMSRDGDDVVISSRIKKPVPAPLIKKGTYSEFSENHYSIRCDGLFHRVQCGMASCVTSCTYLAVNRIEGETQGSDGKSSYWTREVSSDGQEMRIYGYLDKDRKELKGMEVRDRVK